MTGLLFLCAEDQAEDLIVCIIMSSKARDTEIHMPVLQQSAIWLYTKVLIDAILKSHSEKSLAAALKKQKQTEMFRKQSDNKQTIKISQCTKIAYWNSTGLLL